VKTGEKVGVKFMGDKLSLFNPSTGHAVRSALHEVTRHG
jgi:hypothetical protein